MRTKKLQRKLSLEQLDARQLMAGDVSVQVIKDEIIINGDSRGNQVLVQQESQGKFRVTGLNGTTINRGSTGVFTSKSMDIRVNLGDGNDELWIGNDLNKSAMLLEDLTVDMGKGSDLLAVVNLKADDDDAVVLNLGSNSHGLMDNDILYTDSFHVTDDLVINTGSGGDNVEMNRTRVDGKAIVDLGDGGDQLKLVDAAFSDSDFFGGAGVDKKSVTRTKGAKFRSF